MNESLGLAQLARGAAMSPFHFLRLFDMTFGQTPHQFAISARIEQAKLLLAETDVSVTAICAAVGYDSLGTFSTLFHRKVGLTPRAYRARRRRFWPIGFESPRFFVPGCLIAMYGHGTEKQFSRSKRASSCVIMSGEPTTSLL